MRKVAVTSILVAALSVVLVPPARADHLHAPGGLTPNDPRPGEPVRVAFTLYTVEHARYPRDGTPVARANDVEVVARGERQTRRFPATDVGNGRYTAELVFSKAGGWGLSVRYGAGSYGEGDEIPLGKGGLRVFDSDPGTPTGQGGNGGFPTSPRRPTIGLLLLATFVPGAVVLWRRVRPVAP